MNAKRFVTLGVLVALWIVHATALAKEEQQHEAPEFRLTDIYGDKINLSDFQGKIVVLHFWAIWCGSCKLDLQYFQKAHQRYASQDVVVLGLAYASGPRQTVRRFARSLGVKFPVLMADDEVLEVYNVATFPTNIIIDRQGKLRIVVQRLMSQAYWDRTLSELIREGDETI